MRTCPAQSHQSKRTPSLFRPPRGVLGIANRLYSLRRPTREVPFTYFMKEDLRAVEVSFGGALWETPLSSSQ